MAVFNYVVKFEANMGYRDRLKKQLLIALS